MVYENDSCSNVLCLQLLSSVPTSSRRACRYGALFHPLSAECYTTPHDSAVWSTLLHQGWPHFFLQSCIFKLFVELLLSSQCYDGVVLAIAMCLSGCRKSQFCQSIWMYPAVFLAPRHPLTYPALYFKKIQYLQKQRYIFLELHPNLWTFYFIFMASSMPSVLWRCWLGGRKGIRPVKNMSGGVLAWLSVWSKMQTCIWPSWCQCHSLSLASVKSRLVLPFWYRLTRVVLDKGPLNGCVFHGI